MYVIGNHFCMHKDLVDKPFFYVLFIVTKGIVYQLKNIYLAALFRKMFSFGRGPFDRGHFLLIRTLQIL